MCPGAVTASPFSLALRVGASLHAVASPRCCLTNGCHRPGCGACFQLSDGHFSSDPRYQTPFRVLIGRSCTHAEETSTPILGPLVIALLAVPSLRRGSPVCSLTQLPYPILPGKCFLPSVGFLATFLIVSLEVQKILISTKSSYLFSPLLLTLVASYREASAKSEMMKVCSLFFCKSFIALAFAFRFLTCDR